MDDLEFDKHFANKMRQTSAPDFSDEDWARLSPMLVSRQKRKSRVLPLWWLGALSGLLLCSNIGWWWMWRQSEKRIDALRTEWIQMQPQKIRLTDTTYARTVVYQYDTVYRTKVYSLFSEKPSSSYSMQGKVPAQTGLAEGAGTGMESQLTAQKRAATGILPVLGAGPDSIADRSGRMSTQDALACLPTPIAPLPIPLVKYKAPSVNLLMAPLKGARSSYGDRLIPRKFRVGAGMNWVKPQAASLTSKSGFDLHLIGECAFSEQLALTLEGAYLAMPFAGKRYDEGLGLPPEEKPGDDYVLKYFESDEQLKTILQGTIGMQYWFVASRALSPYLGFGYALQWYPSFELKVEYHNPVLDKEKEVSVEVPAQSTPVSLLDFNAGIRYRMTPHLRWQFGANYQYKPLASQVGIPQFWGLQSSFLYAF